MASNTTNYGWTKPDYEDDADIMVINDTIDNIDAVVHNLNVEVSNKNPLTPGTPMVLTETWDLFSLPIGKYYRQSNVSEVLNIPGDLTAAFYCVIENTISSSRRRILLYPATSSLAGVYYTCVETSSGYGSWYKFTGEAVT